MQDKDNLPNPETSNLFDEIKKSIEIFNDANKTKEDITNKKIDELKKVTQQIDQRYDPLFKEVDEAITTADGKVKSFSKLIEVYSTFDENLINKTLIELIRIFDEKEFSFCKPKHIIKYLKSGFWGGTVEDENWDYVKMIVAKNKVQSEYHSSKICTDYNALMELVNQGNAILLDDNFIYPDDNQITFYVILENYLKCKVSFGHFSYLKDFIDNVIQYRYEHNMKVITEEDMLVFMKNFIDTNKEVIMNKYNARLNVRVKSLKLEKNTNN